MKNRTALLISAALCFCVWAAVCIPIHPQIQEAVFEPSFQYYRAVRAYFDQQEDAGPSDGDTVYLYTASNLAGKEQTVLFCPWVETVFRDVGTYGRSDWSVGLHDTTFSWDGKALSPFHAAKPGKSVCTVKPDKNTVLTSPFFSEHFPEYKYVNEYAKEITQNDWGKDDTWSLDIHAATEDSAVSPNTEATATVQWSGEFYIRRKLWPSVKIPFSAAAEGTYLSNGK